MKRLFRALRRDPDDSYDAIVIGAGIGGLTCANLLARANLRVLLVEQHYMVGGYCSTFRRKGYTFDAATHFYPLLGNPKTMTGKLLADLGVTTEWVKMDPVDHFHCPDGSQFSVPADFDQYLAKLKGEFAHEADALDRFFQTVRDAYLAGLLYYFRGSYTYRLDEFRPLSVATVIDRFFRDPKLKLLLTGDCSHWGSPPSRTSFVFDSMLRLSYFLGNFYPRGGSQVFADELAHRFEARGGHILMHALTTGIVVEDGAARGIDVQIGPGVVKHLKRVKADVVISNADLVQTVRHLLDPSEIDPAYLRAVDKLRPTHPCFLTHIAVRDMPTDVLQHAQGYYWRSWNSEDVTRDAFKIFVPTIYEPRMAPPGGHIVILQKLIGIEYDAIDDWAAHKAAVEEDLLSRLERAIPGFSKHIVTALSASALTSYRYTLNYRGAMLGWEMSPDQLAESRPSTEGPLKNLFFVGHWTQPGGGITPVMVSAMQVAQAIVSGRPGQRGGEWSLWPYLYHDPWEGLRDADAVTRDG
jgi:phytoene dehydrogenase-like protein